MKLDQDAISRLAAEYVLGTLRGRARLRFERMMAERPDVAGAVQQWAERWCALYEDLPDQPPAPGTWQRIEHRLGWTDKPSLAARLWNNLPLWRTVTALALTAVIATTAFWRPAELPVEQSAPSALVLVLADDEKRVGWVMAAAENRLQTRPLRDLQIDQDRDYELWLVPSDEAPRSLGLIDPQTSSAFELESDLAARLRPGATLAVSLEPTGGSPTGQPTGPIVYTGQIIEL